MLIDCDGCSARGASCSGCLVSALFDTPAGLADLAPAELRAIEAFELAGFDVEVLETPPAPVPVRLIPARPRHVA
jgi:hypothetical protein